GLLVRPQCEDVSVLNDLGSGREQVSGGVVVVLVEGLAPRADDALGRGRAGAAAGDEHDDRHQRQEARAPHASASRTSSWKWVSRRSLSGSNWPPSSNPETTPC